MADDHPLKDLIEAVADGTLDSRRIPANHSDPTISQLLAELKVLAGVADIHRLQVASDEATTTDALGAEEPTIAATSNLGGVAGIPPGNVAVVHPEARWGNFELIKKVGEGTFGEVFLARDLWLGHDVALKLLKANIADRAKMLHEARMLVRVRHLNVVMVHGADVHGGRLGFWMDFVEGSTLHDAIHREGPRSAGEASAWGQDLCRALAAVHKAGIIHRDVKAQNVMRRTSDGRLILMDFGAGELLGATRTGPGVGTPLYLAPELLKGAEASTSSDIYALGVLLFFLVSRRFPIRATSWNELISAHERRERVRLEDIRPDVPPSFVDVIERALKPDPAQRYASAGEMLAAMRSGNDSGPLTISTRVPPPMIAAASPSPYRQTLIRVGWMALALFGLTLMVGYVACVAFEQILKIDPFFAMGVPGYLSVGREAALPLVLTWVFASALVAVVGGARDLLTRRRDSQRPATQPVLLERIDPLVLGTAICVAGGLGLVVTTIWFNPIISALEELRTGVAAPTRLALLAPGGTNTNFGLVSALVSFALGFAAWKWFPVLEKRAKVQSPIRALRWATVGMALLMVAISVIPRRFVWDDFEVVQYEKRRAFVLASRGELLLLYLADSPGQPLRRVSATAAALERTGSRHSLFGPPS